MCSNLESSFFIFPSRIAYNSMRASAPVRRSGLVHYVALNLKAHVAFVCNLRHCKHLNASRIRQRGLLSTASTLCYIALSMASTHVWHQCGKCLLREFKFVVDLRDIIRHRDEDKAKGPLHSLRQILRLLKIFIPWDPDRCQRLASANLEAQIF